MPPKPLMRLTPQLHQEMEALRGYLLLHKDRVFALDDFEVETRVETRSRWFGPPRTRTRLYLLRADIAVYAPDFGWGYMSDDNAQYFLTLYSLSHLRQQWVDLRTSLEKLGFQIIKTHQHD